MKQFICTLIALAASAGLLFLVSVPINNLHGAGDHEETHVEGHVEEDGHAEEGEESADHGEAAYAHGDSADTDAAAH